MLFFYCILIEEFPIKGVREGWIKYAKEKGSSKKVDLSSSEDLTILTPINEYNKAYVARVRRVIENYF